MKNSLDKSISRSLELIGKFLLSITAIAPSCIVASLAVQNSSNLAASVALWITLTFGTLFAIWKGGDLGRNVFSLFLRKPLQWRGEILAKASGTTFGITAFVSALYVSAVATSLQMS